MKKNFKYLFLIVMSLGIFSSCSEEDLDPTLQQSKDIEISVNTVSDLEAILNGAYNRMSLSAYYGRDIIILGEVFSDNTYSNANSNRFVAEARMDFLPTTGTASTLWAQAYAVIGSANIIINSENITGDEARIDQIRGQALTIRALAHFDLLTFYGQQNVGGSTLNLSAPGVPYVTEFRNEDELFPGRVSVQEVLDMAYADLDMAQTLMDESAGNAEYLNIWGSYGVEARIANYFGDDARALEAAGAIIESGNYEVVSEGNFLGSFQIDNAVNSIFEIAASENDNEGINGLANIYQAGSYGDVVVLPNLAAIYDDGDIRGVGGVITQYTSGTLRNTGKYPSTAPYEDNISIIRYEEMILIYAEALLATDPAEALVYLNMIPENRNADTYAAATLENILLERRKELAFEGFRFHDLARTGKDIPIPDPVQQTHGGPAYGSYNFALPIPANEVDANSNITQNQGYGQ